MSTSLHDKSLVIERDVLYSWLGNAPFLSSKSGIGNGEEALLEMVGGQIMGYSASWDITDANGFKWEVKEPSSGMIRLCTSGRIPAGRVISVVESAVSQLLSAHLTYGIDMSILLLPSVTFDFVEFIDQDVPLLLRGEITRGRFQRLFDIISALEMHRRGIKRFHRISLDSTDFKVDSITYAKIAELIGTDEIFVDAKSGVLSKLTNPVFADPLILKQAWASVTPECVFPDVDGVVLVNEFGFRAVFRDQLSERFEFTNVSQGVPKFRYIGPPLEKKKKPKIPS